MHQEPWRAEAMARGLVPAFVVAVVAGLLLPRPLPRRLIGRADPIIDEAIGEGRASFPLLHARLIDPLAVAAHRTGSEGEEDVRAEAGAPGAPCADLGSSPEPLRSRMRGMPRDRTLSTVHEDRPAHRRGAVPNGGTDRLEAMRLRLSGFEPATAGQEAVHAGTAAVEDAPRVQGRPVLGRTRGLRFSSRRAGPVRAAPLPGQRRLRAFGGRDRALVCRTPCRGQHFHETMTGGGPSRPLFG